MLSTKRKYLNVDTVFGVYSCYYLPSASMLSNIEVYLERRTYIEC